MTSVDISLEQYETVEVPDDIYRLWAPKLKDIPTIGDWFYVEFLNLFFSIISCAKLNVMGANVTVLIIENETLLLSSN